MTQNEQVIEALKSNGGYATLGQLYHLIDFSTWGTKTPQASVRRIVQVVPEIFKIKPGLWALEGYRDTLPPHIFPREDTPAPQAERYNHSHYQGLLLEIGNMQHFNTYVPAQDKNQLFLDKTLNDVAQSTTCPKFSYEHVIRRARTIDVIWFNDRGFPSAIYEVEHSTDFQNSLLKFVELQDFNIEFRVVADKARKRLFEDKINQVAFQSINKRVKFVDYADVSKLYEHQSVINMIKL